MLFAPKEKGQGLVEYAIILAFVALVVIALCVCLVQRLAIPSATSPTPCHDMVVSNKKSLALKTRLFLLLPVGEHLVYTYFSRNTEET